MYKKREWIASTLNVKWLAEKKTQILYVYVVNVAFNRMLKIGCSCVHLS
jgi:hypothetical protein